MIAQGLVEMARQPSEKQLQRIFEAADSLASLGITSPTNDQVLEKMGGGSIADVSPAMREWRGKKKLSDQIMFSMPDNIKEAGLRFTTQMWAYIDSEAKVRVDQAQNEANIKTIELEEELQECLNSIASLEDSLVTKNTDYNSLKEELNNANEEIKALEKSAHRLELDKEKALTRLEIAKENEESYRKQVSVLQNELVLLAKLNGSHAALDKEK
jgi:septal ring factor EnvC (AmiA/AmiB activator)